MSVSKLPNLGLLPALKPKGRCGRKRLSQKKITHELAGDLRKLIQVGHAQLSISQQVTLLGLSRSSYYYQPVGESAENLVLMERIDKLFTARPETGLRRMHQEVTSEGNPVNIKRVHRLMRLMGLEAVYQKPNLSKPAEGHQIYPYLLRGVSIEGPDHVWSTDITYIQMAHGFLYLCVVIERSGVPVVHALHSKLAFIKHAAG
ncbi:IS3 family transposase [Spirosoma endophyticum]|uniref:HTH-like domain-containing protein n=1 Tax=Spirosoma endophyticum TaxID=662367 RepID=A0A1I2FQ83_9BACT|nr:IS3 family transposase [Spirosoma endophyticum]SFF07662.1 HTH-like domain-containing protein [Spirosoma endophyticum]